VHSALESDSIHDEERPTHDFVQKGSGSQAQLSSSDIGDCSITFVDTVTEASAAAGGSFAHHSSRPTGGRSGSNACRPISGVRLSTNRLR